MVHLITDVNGAEAAVSGSGGDRRTTGLQKIPHSVPSVPSVLPPGVVN